MGKRRGVRKSRRRNGSDDEGSRPERRQIEEKALQDAVNQRPSYEQ